MAPKKGDVAGMLYEENPFGEGGAEGGAGGSGGATASDNVVLSFKENEYTPEVTGKIGKTAQAPPPPGPIPGPDSATDPGQPQPQPSVFSLARYRGYFDVDTRDVLGRAAYPIAYFWKPDFFEAVQRNPDLYGPFWVTTTLVFSAAVMGNMHEWIEYHFRSAKPDGGDGDNGTGAGAWFYDVDKVSYSAILFYGYVTVIPLLFWLVMKYFRSPQPLIALVCIYGYSLSPFIPVSALSVIPSTELQWVLVAVATALSAIFLVLNFRSCILQAIADAQEWIENSVVGRSFLGKLSDTGLSYVILLTIALLHVGLGLAMKLYFFHYSGP
ncbi:unnamed protein product [Pedinophyceae sp. YPF-701]|nr:unnamed protein product [Pedinophyceae sp. YPF-701]